MGVSYSTARWLAPASFLFDFAAQNYGMLAKPNMKDIHDANMSFFSPQPYFILGFFLPQQLFQLAWLYRLWKLNPDKSEKEKRELDTIVQFAPYYAVGNACIGIWMFFWNASMLKASNVPVIINTLTQLFYVYAKLGPMNLNSTSSILTHIVSKTFAGIGVLDILHNTSVAYFVDEPANTLVKVLTGVGFAAGGAVSDWILGGSLVYDLVAISVGQSSLDKGWSGLLGAYAAVTAAIVVGKNYYKPPYVHEAIDYDLAYGDEEDV